MKKYFVTVQTFSNTTKLGRIVAKKVYGKYQHSLITDGKQTEIVDYINKVMHDALKENPRLKEMKVTYNKFINTFAIDLRPDTMVYEKYALSVTGSVVRNEFCEEGGER